ncbi:MAG TPA: hypothetical protein VEH29_16910 [Acidimicrobiales bacterium]|nr:hypothetical protein [Acidimicrobiales bacterium]
MTALASSSSGSVAFAATAAYEEVAPYTTTYGIMRWTGSKWVTTTFPTFSGGGYLGGLAVSSSTDAWGLAYVGAAQTLELLHWTGTGWSQIALPTADAHAESGVIASSGSTVFVGGGLPGVGPEIPFLLKYAGTWKTETLPTLPKYSMIQSMYAKSPTSVSMIAEACLSTGCTSNVLLPSGSTWKDSSLGGAGAELTAIAGEGAELMTGGAVRTPTSEAPLLEVYKSSKWSSIKVLKSLNNATLRSVSLNSATSAWIGGNQDTESSHTDKWQLLVDRMDGAKWVSDAPKIPGKNAFFGSLASGGSHAWVFGTSWAGTPCSSTATLVGYYWAGKSWASVTLPFGVGGSAMGSSAPDLESVPDC